MSVSIKRSSYAPLRLILVLVILWALAMLSDGLPGVKGASKALTATGETLTTDALPGDTMVRVTGVRRFLPGILVGIGQGETFEVKRIKGIAGDFLVFDEPLEHPHASGESVGIIGIR